MTKDEIIEELKEKGIEFNSRDSKAKLEALLPVEEIDAEESETNERMDVIGQNGNTGEHYDQDEDQEEDSTEDDVEEEVTEMSLEDFWRLYKQAEEIVHSLVKESNKINDLKPLSRRLRPVSNTLSKFKRFKKD